MDVLFETWVTQNGLEEALHYFWNHEQTKEFVASARKGTKSKVPFYPDVVAQNWATHEVIQQQMAGYLERYKNAFGDVTATSFGIIMTHIMDEMKGDEKKYSGMKFFDANHLKNFSTLWNKIMRSSGSPLRTGVELYLERMQEGGVQPGTQEELNYMKKVQEIDTVLKELDGEKRKLAGQTYALDQSEADKKQLQGKVDQLTVRVEELGVLEDQNRKIQAISNEVSVTNTALVDQLQAKQGRIKELDQEALELAEKLNKGPFDIDILPEKRIKLGILDRETHRYDPNKIYSIDSFEVILDMNNVARDAQYGQPTLYTLVNYLPDGTYDQFHGLFSEVRVAEKPLQDILTDVDGKQYPCTISPRGYDPRNATSWIVQLGNQKSKSVVDEDGQARRKAAEVVVLADVLINLSGYYHNVAQRTVEDEALEEKVDRLEEVLTIRKGAIEDLKAKVAGVTEELETERAQFQEELETERAKRTQALSEMYKNIGSTVQEKTVLYELRIEAQAESISKKNADIVELERRVTRLQEELQKIPRTSGIRKLISKILPKEEPVQKTTPAASQTAAGIADIVEDAPTSVATPTVSGTPSRSVVRKPYGAWSYFKNAAAVLLGLATVVYGGGSYVNRIIVAEASKIAVLKDQIELRQISKEKARLQQFIEQPELRAQIRRAWIQNALQTKQDAVDNKISQYVNKHNIQSINYGTFQDDLAKEGFTPEQVFVYVHRFIPDTDAKRNFLRAPVYKRRQKTIRLN